MKTTYYKIFKSKYLKISLLLLFLISAFSAVAVQAEMLSIKGDNVNLRTGPGKNYKIKFEYGAGFPVELVEKKGNWLKVKDFEDDTGWVHKSFLNNSIQTIVKANRNTDQKINIRKGPASDTKIIGMAYYGVVFKILRNQAGWVEVEHESGLKGWVSSHLLWVN